MKPGFTALMLIVATLAAQRVLSLPQAPLWATALLLPMPWVVGPALLTDNRRWYSMSFAVGLLWDALFEPVIGPGAISWSCAAAVAWGLAGVIVNRGPRSWFAFGSLGAAVFWSVRLLSQAIVGLHLTPGLTWVFGSILLSGLLCGFIGWLLWIDLPRQWRMFRARRLR